jgi:hypothetical protein
MIDVRCGALSLTESPGTGRRRRQSEPRARNLKGRFRMEDTPPGIEPGLLRGATAAA